MTPTTPTTMNTGRQSVKKGWGFELWLANSELYCGKILFIYPGSRGSYHYHKLKDETFYCARGSVQVHFGHTDDEEAAATVVLREGDSLHVPAGARHRLIGLHTFDIGSEGFNEPIQLVEFSTQHFDDDTYRVSPGD